jgi:AhpD family alkylhydroperoxidase
MQARMKNPVMVFPEAMPHILAVNGVIEKSGLSKKTRELVHLRVSQINGCAVCLDMHARELERAGETNERLFALAAWREAPYYTDAERAALAVAEAATRLADRPESVSDEIWNEAARHYNERELAALVLSIAMINFWNRVNATTRQIAGEWAKSGEARKWVEERQHAHAG